MELSKFFSHTAMRAIKGRITLLSIFFCESKWPSSTGSCIGQRPVSANISIVDSSPEDNGHVENFQCSQLFFGFFFLISNIIIMASIELCSVHPGWVHMRSHFLL